jgi:hypothetical protein
MKYEIARSPGKIETDEARPAGALVGSRDTSVEVDFNLSSRVTSQESRTVSESIISSTVPVPER